MLGAQVTEPMPPLAELVEGLLVEHGELDPKVLMSKRVAGDQIEALVTVGTGGPKRIAKTVLVGAGGALTIYDGFPCLLVRPSGS